MKRMISLMTGGALALLVGTADAATTTGKVVATDTLTNTLTIETDAGKQFLFTRNDATKIEQKGATVALGDIRKDSKVTVTTEQEPMQLKPMLAFSIEVDEMAVAEATPIPESAARVESAGADGGQPTRTAQVQSAEYDDAAQRSADRLPTTATPLPLIAVLGAASLASGLFLRLRNRS